MAYAADILRQTAEAKDVQRRREASLTKMRGTAAGMIIGAVGGAAVAYKKKWSLLWCGFLGAVVGGAISKIISPSTLEDEA